MRYTNKTTQYLFLFLVSLLSVLLLVALTPNINPNIKYGTPFNTGYTITRDQYVVGYNTKTNIPSWVSWELNKSWLGDAIRSNKFISDSSLPSTFVKVTSDDYTNSGYDRGHMANSEDRSNNQINNDSTFIMTNIVPQAADNNRGPWKYLEEFCRTIVKNDKDYSLYIVSGPIESIGTLKGKVSIPKNLYKTVLIEYKGKPIKGFAVIIPNINGIVNDSWKKYITSIRNVEGITKYNFYSTLDKKTQDLIETNPTY